jgi:hypothetical protein
VENMDFKKHLIQIIQKVLTIVASGVLIPIFLIVAINNGVENVSSADAIELSIYIAFIQVFISIMKGGFDNQLYALSVKSESIEKRNFHTGNELLIFANITLVAILANLFYKDALVIVLVTVIVESVAAIRIAENIGYNDTRGVLISNLSKQMLFILYVLLFDNNTYNVQLAFMITSILKLLILTIYGRKIKVNTNTKKVDLALLYNAHSVLNNIMFRSDQIIIKIIMSYGLVSNMKFIVEVMSVVKIIEVASYLSIVIVQIMKASKVSYKNTLAKLEFKAYSLVLLAIPLIITILIFISGFNAIISALIAVFGSILAFSINYISVNDMTTGNIKKITIAMLCTLMLIPIMLWVFVYFDNIVYLPVLTISIFISVIIVRGLIVDKSVT